MNTEKKMRYLPPNIKVTQVVLEGNIAVQSVNKKNDVKDWEPDPEQGTNDKSDIWVNF
jgi:hypothetical protein